MPVEKGAETEKKEISFHIDHLSLLYEAPFTDTVGIHSNYKRLIVI